MDSTLRARCMREVFMLTAARAFAALWKAAAAAAAAKVSKETMMKDGVQGGGRGAGRRERMGDAGRGGT